MLAGASARGAESLCEGKAPGRAGGSRGAAPPLLSLQCHNRTRGGENNQLASARGKPPAGWGVQGGQRPPCSRCNAIIEREEEGGGRKERGRGIRPLRAESPRQGGVQGAAPLAHRFTSIRAALPRFGPCQGPRRGGVQGAAPLAHRFTSIQSLPRIDWSRFHSQLASSLRLHFRPRHDFFCPL